MIGTTVGHYRILGKLGEGGMGVVYKAEDTKLNRNVALKFLPAELTRDEDAERRFFREAQAASALDHPNIGVIHEIDKTDDGRSFICMALYEGETLQKRIDRGRLDVGESIGIAIQIAEGLKRAHGAGIIHCDIKPANILITKEEVVKIVDFGLAMLAGPAGGATTGSRAGTAAYMSPEQIQNGPVDARTDLFSVGVVLYEMVTGRRPFEGDHEAALFYSIVYNEPVQPITLRRNIPESLNSLIMRLLQKDARNRFQTAEELLLPLKKLNIDVRRWTVKSGINKPSGNARLGKGKTTIGIVIVTALLIFAPIGWRAFLDWAGSAGVPTEKHIVVLPFKCIGCDQKETAMSGGLMETLTSKLTQFQPSTGSLWVVASSEVWSNEVQSPSQARRVFGANLVVTGTLQHMGNGFRLTLNLVDPATLRQLRSYVFDEASANLSLLQDGIVEAATSLLNINLEPQSVQLLRAGQTRKSAAYELYLQGRGYLQRYERMENLDTAAILFGRAVRIDSHYALAYAGLGESYWIKFENDKDPNCADSAIAYCAKAVRLNGQLVPVRITLGMIYAGTGQNEKAVAQFKEAILVDPFSGRAYSGLGGAYGNLGDTAQAEQAYKRAVSINPTYWGFHNDLGHYYFSLGRTREASCEYQKVVDLTPDNYRGYNNLGAMYFYLNWWDSARAVFEKSIALQPNYHGYSNLGTLLYYQGNISMAAFAYEHALELDDKDYTVWANLAAAYSELGRMENSVNAYLMAVKKAEAVLELSPENAELTGQIAGYYAALGKKEKARSLLVRALNLAPNNTVLLGHAAMTYEELGDRNTAIALLLKAFKKGYSPAEVENAPEMKGLRADRRYRKLLQKNGSKYH